MPDVNEYSAIFQHPETCLSDPSLKRCHIRTSPLGLPRVRSGGFALTYNMFDDAGSNWAVRCFHRESPNRYERYKAISERLRKQDIVSSGYFIDFDFQPKGVTMADGRQFPIVKMSWAKGETLGSFLSDNFADRTKIENLRDSLSGLSSFLRKCNIAHGDIQPGNIMVSDSGATLQLIDYDGMFVPGIENLGAAEIVEYPQF